MVHNFITTPYPGSQAKSTKLTESPKYRGKGKEEIEEKDKEIAELKKQNEELKMRTYIDKDMALVSDQKSDHEYMDRKLKENE